MIHSDGKRYGKPKPRGYDDDMIMISNEYSVCMLRIVCGRGRPVVNHDSPCVRACAGRDCRGAKNLCHTPDKGTCALQVAISKIVETKK